jgi:hypothetical protein
MSQNNLKFVVAKFFILKAFKKKKILNGKENFWTNKKSPR